MKHIQPAYCWRCQKRAYLSESLARQSIEKLLRYRTKIPEYDYALRAYQCRDHPGWFHIGHSTATIAVIKHLTEA